MPCTATISRGLFLSLKISVASDAPPMAVITKKIKMVCMLIALADNLRKNLDKAHLFGEKYFLNWKELTKKPAGSGFYKC